MSKITILELKKSVFDSNDRAAGELRAELSARGVFLINLMSSPGSGKTSSILRIIEGLSGKRNIGVLEADIDSDVDALKVAASGAKALQLHTDGMCHLDAGMTRAGMESPELSGCELVILENVGNLVCPAEFDTGAHKNVMILSVPEGDDKALKYPLMFSVCDLLIINKTDAADYFDFDFALAEERARKIKPDIDIIRASAKTGEGFDEICEWIERAYER